MNAAQHFFDSFKAQHAFSYCPHIRVDYMMEYPVDLFTE